MNIYNNVSGNVSMPASDSQQPVAQVAPFLCQLFYGSHGIPIACWRGEERICNAGLPSDVMPDAHVLPIVRAQSRPYTTYSTPDDAMYGYVHDIPLGIEFVIGPTFPLGRSGLVLDHFMNMSGIPTNRREEVAPILARIPRYTYQRFCALCGFLYLQANAMVPGAEALVGVTDYEAINEVHRMTSQQRDSFSIEQSMLVRNDITRLVREGAVDEIWTGLGSQSYLDNLVNELSTTMGSGNLRMAKDEFIIDATETFLHGAIPGGIGLKLGLQMLSSYVAKCEDAQSEAEVATLLNAMLMDVATVVNDVRTPAGIGPEVRECIKVIADDLANVPTIEQICHRIGCSTSYLTKHFKRETGLTINQYVRYRRMDEAKRLLRYTRYSLSEISDLLGFSSQPYFATTFKRETGITPKQYRIAASNPDFEEEI